jgi:competence protein ComEC
MWAARGPGWHAPTNIEVLHARASWAAAAATLLAMGGLGAGNKKRGVGLLLLSAACLAWARAPMPRVPPPFASKAIEVSGRLVRWQASEFGGHWGLIDSVKDSLGRPVLPADKVFLFSSQVDLNLQLSQMVRLRGVLQSRNRGFQLRNCLVQDLGAGKPLGVRALMRNEVRRRLQHNLPPPHQHLAQALLLGEKSGLDAEQRQSYRQLGLLHLLAISGMHFWVWQAFLKRILPPSLQWLRPITLFGFAMLANFSAPVVRALTAVFLRDWLTSRGRGIAGSQLWAIAIWVELAGLPAATTSLGFLLTYMATGALICGSPPVYASSVRKVIQPSTCAFLGTMPTLHALQGTIEPWSIPFTPLLALLMPPRLLASLAAVQADLAPISLQLMQAMQAMEGRFFSWANQLPATPMAALSLHSNALLIGSGLALLTFSRIRSLTLIHRFALLMPLVAICIFKQTNAPAIAAFPVGHGLACAIIGEEKSLIFDLGSADLNPVNLIDRVFMPGLARLGASQNFDLVLSHRDQDHTNGVDALIDRLNFEQRQCAPWESFEIEGMQPFRIRLLGCPTAGSGESNEGGLVLDVRGPHGRAVMLGDQFGYGLRELRSMIEPGPIELVLLPHHGLTTDGLGELLDYLQPRVAWVSTSSKNFPLPIAAQLQARGIEWKATCTAALTLPSGILCYHW